MAENQRFLSERQKRARAVETIEDAGAEGAQFVPFQTNFLAPPPPNYPVTYYRLSSLNRQNRDTTNAADFRAVVDLGNSTFNQMSILAVYVKFDGLKAVNVATGAFDVAMVETDARFDFLDIRSSLAPTSVSDVNTTTSGDASGVQTNQVLFRMYPYSNDSLMQGVATGNVPQPIRYYYRDYDSPWLQIDKATVNQTTSHFFQITDATGRVVQLPAGSQWGMEFAFRQVGDP